MIPVEREKYVVLVPPQIKNDGAAARDSYVDTKGWGHLRVLIVTGVIDAATTAAPALGECATSGGSYDAITDAALSAAIANGDDDEIAAIDVDLTNGTHLRYIQCLVTAGSGTTGTNLAVIGILSRPTSGAISGAATAAGLTEVVSV